MPERLRVVLCWHMHQPEYRDCRSGAERLPWVYLHAIKDYVDMAAHLEAVPDARAVVNFAPVLLEQLEASASVLRAHLDHGTPLASPLLALLAPGGVPDDRDAWPELLRACLRAHRQHLIERFPPFRELVDEATRHLADGTVSELGPSFLVDLGVWYHLAWLGETVRREDPRVAVLEARGRDYRPAERRELLEIVCALLEGLLPRYSALAASGRVELAMSPWMHPILPLLLDFGVAREAIPDAPLPAATCYPGGEERAIRHLQHGRGVFRRLLGVTPRGCWPSEGALSTATVALLSRQGFAWAASGEGVLRGTLDRQGLAPVVERLHRGWRVEGHDTTLFFRSDHLSDLIGFNYSHWHGDDAVADLCDHLERLALELGDAPGAVVSIILDGENAWEHYPFNGYWFLRGLYQRLAAHPRLQLATYADCVAGGAAADSFGGLRAGSWVHGTLSTWIGEASKNRCWELLVDAKQAFDEAAASGSLGAERLARAERQLAVCEGSDWAWWYGDYNPTDAVTSFDALYRHHLAGLYELLGRATPAAARIAIANGDVGGAAELGGVMRRGAEPAQVEARQAAVRTPVLGRRLAGVLLHPSSLPGARSAGALGAAAHRWLEVLERAGFGVWQMLPLGPVGADGSPYLARSSHAGNEQLLDLQMLVEHGLLHGVDAAAVHGHAVDTAFERLQSSPSHPWHAELRRFEEAESGWLADYSLFEALARDQRLPWWEWPAPLRDRDPSALGAVRHRLALACSRIAFGQFLFLRQWQGLRAAAAARGIALFGDLPIYVAQDSAEVWCHRELFELDATGWPTRVAGVPPDYFAADGQRWGNPLYRWERHQADGFRWWRARLHAQLALADLVRIDHFRGLESYWEIPAASPHAREGAWRAAPGVELLAALRRDSEGLPLVAEDLGVITPAVEALRDAFELPGMRVLQFGFDGSSTNPHLPHNHVRRSVVYSGTHDNDTAAAWYAGLDAATARRVREYLRGDPDADSPTPARMADVIVRATLASVADVAIVPLQDLLRLGGDARMNTPGTVRGNWRWGFDWSEIGEADIARWRRWNELFGRLSR
jgi:4-alpha-glucanotransferase/alpha-amylase/alpha-mannosidase (GH57 family)